MASASCCLMLMMDTSASVAGEGELSFIRRRNQSLLALMKMSNWVSDQ